MTIEIRIAVGANGKAYVVNHLTTVVLDGEETFALSGEVLQNLFWEWVQGQRTHEANFVTLSAQGADSRLGDTADGTKSDHNEVSVFGFKAFSACKFLHFRVFCLQVAVLASKSAFFEEEGLQEARWAVLCAFEAPRGSFVGIEIVFRPRQDRLFHLANNSVAKYEHWGAEFVCNFKCFEHHVVAFLARTWGQDVQAIVAVTAALNCLEIVALGWANVTKTWATAVHINNNTWQFATCHIRDSFLHERHAWA